jgi:hypothetical protein
MLNIITNIAIVLLLSIILLLYIFEFGYLYAQNYDNDNNDNNNEIENNFDYIFDPGNYIEFEEEKKEKEVVVRNDNSDNVENQENLVSSSSSSTNKVEKEEVKDSNNINTLNKKNSGSKLKIIDGNNDNNQNINNKNNEYLDYVNNNNEENKQENYNLDSKVIVKTRLNLENIEKEGYLNIAAFINGQGVLKNVSLDDIEPTKKKLTVSLAVDKETDIVEAGSRDEFFVCAYHIKDLYNKKEFNNALTYFDCDEGDLTGSDESTISRLFSSSSQVYQKSQNIFANSSSKYSQLITANKNINNNNNNINRNQLEENEKQEDTVKIKVYAPLEDRKDIQKLKIIAMVKGQIKSAVIDNVQEEFDKIGGYKVSRTFTFERDTNIGKIQIGDKFFACVSSIELNPPEGSECEKRTIKYIGKKENVLYAR